MHGSLLHRWGENAGVGGKRVLEPTQAEVFDLHPATAMRRERAPFEGYTQSFVIKSDEIPVFMLRRE